MATTGVPSQQIRTTTPSTVDGTASSNSEGTSVSMARADHTHATNYTTPDGRTITFASRFAELQPAAPKQSLVTVVCGNSISNQSKWNVGATSSYLMDAEIQLANVLSGGAMRFKRMTASTRADKYGTYGYSSQKLSAILGDIQAQWLDPLDTAGIIPDLVIGHALFENSISLGDSAATIQNNTTAWVRWMQARWPGAIILLCTPHPSEFYTGGAVAVYETIRDYVLGLDNGYSIITARLDEYVDPDSPGVPLSGYTDGVHPNAKGALVNARVIAAALNRISRAWGVPYRVLGSNMALTGSAAAGGTNVTGTVPTGVAVTGHASATFVATAEDPGFTLSITKATGATLDANNVALGSQSLSSVTELSPFAVVELVSGAEHLRLLNLEPRINDGSGNSFQYYFWHQGSQANQDWEDGDILTLRAPPMVAASGSITACNPYLRFILKSTDGTIVFRVLSQGVGIVS